MTQTWVEALGADPSRGVEIQQERLILEITELICKLMNERGVNKTELARRLGKTKGYVTQLLDGGTNMTLKTVSDALFALDSGLGIHVRPLDAWSAQPKPIADLYLVSETRDVQGEGLKCLVDVSDPMAGNDCMCLQPAVLTVGNWPYCEEHARAAIARTFTDGVPLERLRGIAEVGGLSAAMECVHELVIAAKGLAFAVERVLPDLPPNADAARTLARVIQRTRDVCVTAEPFQAREVPPC